MYRNMTVKLNILSGKEGHAECVMETMEDVQKYVTSEVMPRLKKGWHLDSTTELIANSNNSQQEVVGKIWEKVEKGGQRGSTEQLLLRPTLTAG